MPGKLGIKWLSPQSLGRWKSFNHHSPKTFHEWSFSHAACLRDLRIPNWKFPSIFIHFYLVSNNLWAGKTSHQILHTRHATSCILHDENVTALVFSCELPALIYQSDLWIKTLRGLSYLLFADGSCHWSLSHLKKKKNATTCEMHSFALMCMSNTLNGNSLCGLLLVSSQPWRLSFMLC